MRLGISIDTIDQVQEIHTNRSLNAEMTEVARMLNERGLPPMSEALLALQRHLPGPPFGFPPYVVRQFEDAYLGSNRRLAERLQDLNLRRCRGLDGIPTESAWPDRSTRADSPKSSNWRGGKAAALSISQRHLEIRSRFVVFHLSVFLADN